MIKLQDVPIAIRNGMTFLHDKWSAHSVQHLTSLPTRHMMSSGHPESVLMHPKSDFEAPKDVM